MERIERVITSLPTIGELDPVEYVGGVSMGDPWVVRTDLSGSPDDHRKPS